MFYFQIYILLCLYQTIYCLDCDDKGQRCNVRPGESFAPGFHDRWNLFKRSMDDNEQANADRLVKRAEIFGGNFDRANIFRKKRATIMGGNFLDAQRMQRPDDQLVDNGQMMSQNLAKEDPSDLEKLFANRVINKRAKIFGGNFDRANIFRKKRATILGGEWFRNGKEVDPNDPIMYT
ncbi:hypothetical protein BpHYR1_049504, partial [Brachionus plicatilis]